MVDEITVTTDWLLTGVLLLMYMYQPQYGNNLYAVAVILIFIVPTVLVKKP